MNFIINNVSNIIIIAVLILAAAAVLIKMHKDKKSGKCACGSSVGCSGSCAGCPYSQMERELLKDKVTLK